MTKLIRTPSTIEAAGTKPKLIEEFIGLVNTNSDDVSIARMRSPGGWLEPGQTPDFDEYSLVLSGVLRVETKDGVTDVGAGQAIIAPKGAWVRYSTPTDDGAEYVAVCKPAFSMERVNRDE